MPNPIADPLVENIDTDATSSLVRIEATPEGAVTITINSPATKNAFDAQVIAALHQAFETMHGAEGVRVVFLRGEGGTFSAGANLDWMAAAADLSEADNRDDAMAMAAMLKTLWDIPALTVALIEGGAFGGGAGLAAACDMAIAVKGTKFSFSEVRLGLIAATISPYVVRAIGPRHARALFATGRVFDAAHAETIGLVSEVVAADGLAPPPKAPPSTSATVSAGMSHKVLSMAAMAMASSRLSASVRSAAAALQSRFAPALNVPPTPRR